MIQINLIPEFKVAIIKARAVRFKVIAVSIAACIISISTVLVFVIYTYGVQALSENNISDQLKLEQTKIESVKDLTQLLTIQNQLSTIPKIHNSMSINSRIFEILTGIQKNTGNELVYSSVNVDSKNSTISLAGQVPSYSSYEIFLKSIKNLQVQYKTSANTESQTKPFANNLNIGQASYGINAFGNASLSFSIGFQYPIEIFAVNTTEIKIFNSLTGNLSDSYLGIPSSLFNGGTSQ